MNLFKAVDQNATAGRIFFLENKKLEAKDWAIVVLLPLIFQEKCGSRIWTQFFQSVADTVVGYIENKVDVVKAKEDEAHQTKYSLGV